MENMKEFLETEIKEFESQIHSASGYEDRESTVAELEQLIGVYKLALLGLKSQKALQLLEAVERLDGTKLKWELYSKPEYLNPIREKRKAVMPDQKTKAEADNSIDAIIQLAAQLKGEG